MKEEGQIMPPVEKHVKTSVHKTGNENRAVHEWIDGDPAKKAERHDITKIYDHGKAIEERYGREGVDEYIQHLHDDVKGKFGHILHDLQKQVAEALEYFGVKAAPAYAIKP